MLSFLWETFQLRPLWGHFHPDKAFFLINLPCLACPHFWSIVFHSQQMKNFAKGQIISKGLFGVLEFFPKQMNEFFVVVKTNSFVRFLGEFEDTKSPFEII